MGLFDFFKKKDGFIKIDVRELVVWDQPNGEGCLVSDRITKDGYKVGYMYREQPDDGKPDSGWRFLAGDETEDYIDDPNNTHIFAINTVCNYDPDIIPFIQSEVGSAYIRTAGGTFEPDDGTKPICTAKQTR